MEPWNYGEEMRNTLSRFLRNGYLEGAVHPDNTGIIKSPAGEEIFFTASWTLGFYKTPETIKMSVSGETLKNAFRRLYSEGKETLVFQVFLHERLWQDIFDAVKTCPDLAPCVKAVFDADFLPGTEFTKHYMRKFNYIEAERDEKGNINPYDAATIARRAELALIRSTSGSLDLASWAKNDPKAFLENTKAASFEYLYYPKSHGLHINYIKAVRVCKELKKALARRQIELDFLDVAIKYEKDNIQVVFPNKTPFVLLGTAEILDYIRDNNDGRKWEHEEISPYLGLSTGSYGR